MNSPSRARRFGPVLLLVAAAVGLGGGCVSSSPDKRVIQYLNTSGFGNRYVGNAEEENYLSIGDRVQYIDSYNPDVNGIEIVDVDGTIVVPEVGAVPVAGLTRTEVEALLTQRFSPYFQRNDIKVTIATSSQKFYFVLGEVPNPGIRPFKGDLTIFEAVMKEKPKENSAHLGRVKLIRADPRDPLVITVPITDMIREGDSTFNVLIKERDIVVIPPTMLAQVGYFISDLIFPFTTVIKQIAGALFIFNFQNQNNKFGKNQGFNVF